MAKHADHIPTVTAVFPSDIALNKVIVTVEHCGCTSFSRGVDSAAKRTMKARARYGTVWALTDADYAINAGSGNYCVSKITFERRA